MRRAVLLLVMVISLLPLSAAMHVDDYALSIVVDNARSMHIKEDIEVEYATPSHGFLRDIQYRFGNVRADVENIVTTPHAAIEKGRENIMLRFGDSEHLLTGGPYRYSIEYDYALGADVYDDYDEIYYNIVTPDAWESGMDNVSFSITLPYPVSEKRIWLTYGPYGSSELLPFELSADGRTIRGEYQALPYGYGMTIRVEMDEGYFDAAEAPLDLTKLSFFLSLFVDILMVAVAALLWHKHGRDDALTVPVRFEPPEGMNPLDTGYIYNGCLENSAVSAMLIYWADKGLLTISEKEGRDFLIMKTGELGDDAPESEQKLFQAFFSASDTVDAMTLRKDGFVLKLENVKKVAAASYTGPRAFASPQSESIRKMVVKLLAIPVVLHAIASTLIFPGFLTLFALVPSFMGYFVFSKIASDAEKKMRGRGFRLKLFAPAAFVFLFLLVFISNVLVVIGMPSTVAIIETAFFLSSLLVSLSFASAINKRSDFLSVHLAEILGYREFIEKVEKDRIEKLVDEDPEYFYHVLSYAIALGVEERWALKFQDIYTEMPRWYTGSGDVLYIAGFARRWNRVYAPAVMPPKQNRGGSATGRGSSGFSGGGFSGGGGRSW
ncbi:MAG: DUF2207 domain-containing protein [Spirochaetes bacterium]|uniref:DUF2207 domain-containing protein n=1 Tax=Candidatus Ornithospirochaeta stercoripullorum TaxID=2840899 RepID=A0A9D9DY55_9SPIO|nr:DUF2207 domain-containing protein [Candidatus Ornithospirochaeta stercoripullorum]